MTPRQRVLRALEFKSLDRIPRNLWALDWVSMFAAEEMESLQQDFPDDFARVDNVLCPGDRCKGQPRRKGAYVDEWGCGWECGEDGVVGEVKFPPLAKWKALDSFKAPWEVIQRADWDVANCAQEQNLAGENKFLWTFTGIRPFERMQFLRGTENLFIDLAYGTGEVRKLMQMVHDYNVKLLEGWAKTDLDGLGFMDDWGSQLSLLISPAMWRELYKPLYKEYCDTIHKAGKKVFFHSDGHIFEIYEDLIEIGIDAINSQLFCMDIEEIARQFKGRITFWGEIDRQRILPFGTTEDVCSAVGRVRLALDDGTGGLIGQCEWGVKNPPENIRAVFQAWTMPLSELL